MARKVKPLYFIAANDPLVAQYGEVFKQFAVEDKHTLIMSIDKDMVLNGDVAEMQQMIMALQHHPQLIEKMILSIEVKFVEIEDSEIYLKETYWKQERAFQTWFNKLMSFPVMLFFLSDADSRVMALAGDMIADDMLKITVDDNKHAQLGFEGAKLQEVLDRLFTASWLMLIYCHGSGFDPEPYIQALLADLGLPIEFADIHKKYKADIKKGIKFRAVSDDE